MTDDAVPREVVAERMTRLTEVVERHALVHNAARVGRVEEVLVEGASKTDPDRRSGRTRHGKLVHFGGSAADAPPGALLQVEVTHAAPHWLAGDLVAPHRSPARVRIPVTAA
jgi:tRNA-2-methylthio-N6-dimethylallyladenosine synthase